MKDAYTFPILVAILFLARLLFTTLSKPDRRRRPARGR